MKRLDVLDNLALTEDVDLEFKSGAGGIPGSLWETYSAMANTDGGFIVLGVAFKDGQHIVTGLDDPEKVHKAIWDTLNNRGKVSANLLVESQVAVRQLDGKPVIVLEVPRANRRQRPVFVGQNPVTGTYRRNYEGDYHCTEDEVGRMLADRAEEPADSRILQHFGLDDLDEESLRQYRRRFISRSPDHPWQRDDTTVLLTKLGAWRRDRAGGIEGLTVAGLLMFGKAESIRAPEAIPQFHLDYRERTSPDPAVRWVDRVTLDGTWAGNLFQFYQLVIRKLSAPLKLPFQLADDLFRKDDTPVHEAIREALTNALIHADYRGQGGVVIDKFVDRIEMSNAGTLLISFEQLIQGGISECRNKSLQLMFQMVGLGEKAGSGIDRIRQGWRSQYWRTPSIQEQVQPDRVKLSLPMVSVLPDESLGRLRGIFGEERIGRLSEPEIQALVTADLEGEVSNSRMQEITGKHPADLTKMLQLLVRNGFLDQTGQARWTRYGVRMPGVREKLESTRRPMDSIHMTGDLIHKAEDSIHKASTWDSTQSLSDMPEAELAALHHTAQPARQRRRLSPAEMRGIIVELCQGHYLTSAHIAELLGRNSVSLRSRFLMPMVEERLLELRYPEKRNLPTQAYRARRRAESATEPAM